MAAGLQHHAEGRRWRTAHGDVFVGAVLSGDRVGPRRPVVGDEVLTRVVDAAGADAERGRSAGDVRDDRLLGASGSVERLRLTPGGPVVRDGIIGPVQGDT